MASDQEKIGRRRALTVLGSALGALGIPAMARGQRGTGVKADKGEAPVKFDRAGQVLIDEIMVADLSEEQLPVAEQAISERVRGLVKETMAQRTPTQEELVTIKQTMLSTEQSFRELAGRLARGEVSERQAQGAAKAQLMTYLQVLQA